MRHASIARKRGFTLIELLVVIAIIAILAAILFPVFARARAKAQQTACLSNAKQIALAMQMYVSDWDNCYPTANSPSGDFVFDMLQPYIKNNQIYSCPLQPHPYVPRDVYQGGSLGINRWYYYWPGFNGGSTVWFDFDRCPFNDYWQGAHTTTDVRAPAELILIFDVRPGWYNNQVGYGYLRTNVSPPEMGPEEDGWGRAVILGRHQDGANCVFADGHAAWRSMSQLNQTVNVGGLQIHPHFSMLNR